MWKTAIERDNSALVLNQAILPNTKSIFNLKYFYEN